LPSLLPCRRRFRLPRFLVFAPFLVQAPGGGKALYPLAICHRYDLTAFFVSLAELARGHPLSFSHFPIFSPEGLTWFAHLLRVSSCDSLLESPHRDVQKPAGDGHPPCHILSARVRFPRLSCDKHPMLSFWGRFAPLASLFASFPSVPTGSFGAERFRPAALLNSLRSPPCWSLAPCNLYAVQDTERCLNCHFRRYLIKFLSDFSPVFFLGFSFLCEYHYSPYSPLFLIDSSRPRAR